jgi:hypothetical protein
MLDILKPLPRPNVVPSRCEHAGCGCGITRPGWFDADSELGTHNLRFVLDEPAWPARLDMDASWVPLGTNPAPPEDLPNGFMPAESDESTQDTVYSTRAADELVTGLGLDSAQPWLDRVLVRLDPDCLTKTGSSGGDSHRSRTCRRPPCHSRRTCRFSSRPLQPRASRRRTRRPCRATSAGKGQQGMQERVVGRRRPGAGSR